MLFQDSINSASRGVLKKSSMKGGIVMKTTGNRSVNQVLYAVQVGILAFGLTVVLCIPHMTTVADAQGLSGNIGWYHGMAALAEKEIRTKQQYAATENKVKIAANITVTAENQASDLDCLDEKTAVDEKN